MTNRTPFISMMSIVLCGLIEANPPLALHTIEGNRGVCITGTASLANHQEDNLWALKLKYEF